MTNREVHNTEDDFDAEVQQALAAAFGDDAVSIMQDDESSPDSCTQENLTDLDHDRPLVQYMKRLNRQIYGTAEAKASRPGNGDVETRHVVFEVNQAEFGLPLKSVREIAACGKVTALPRTPHWLRGVTSLRGLIVSVVDLQGWLENPQPTQKLQFAKKIIVMRNAENSVETAILADRVLGIRDLPAWNRSDDSRDTHPVFGPRVETGESQMWLLRPDKLFAATQTFDSQNHRQT